MWFDPIAYIHGRKRKIHYKHRDYKEYKTPINKLIPSPETTQFSCSLVFNPWNKPYPINPVFFPTLPHIPTKPEST